MGTSSSGNRVSYKQHFLFEYSKLLFSSNGDYIFPSNQNMFIARMSSLTADTLNLLSSNFSQHTQFNSTTFRQNAKGEWLATGYNYFSGAGSGEGIAGFL